MKHLAIMCLMAGLMACSPETSVPESAASAEGELVVIGHTYIIKSDALGMERRITIRLPQGWLGYEDGENRAYPVIYMIDGGPEQDFPHIAGLAQSREMNDTFSPFILVGIETVNRRYQITPPATDVATYVEELGVAPGGSADFRKFIREDLKPWVEHRYRTSGRNAVLGESLAGLFVVETLMEEPDLFTDYIAINPSLWWEDMTYGVNAKSRLDKTQSSSRRLYLTSAEEGFRHEAGIKALVETLKTDAPEGLSWAYYALAGQETHASAYHGAALGAFRALFPQTVQFGPPGYLLTGERRPAPTDAEKALIAKPCTLKTAERMSLQETYENPLRFSYRCFLQDYGPRPAAGNMKLPFVE